MNQRTLRAILIVFGLLLVVSATLAYCRMPTRASIVSSSPATATVSSDGISSEEIIPEETIPLAAPQSGSPVIATAITVVRTTAPAAIQQASEQPAAEQPAQEQPAQEAPAQEQPAQEEPAQEEPAQEQPAQEEPAQEEPAPVKSTAAIRLLERANTLLSQFNACATSAEKRTLLGITNNNFSNDSFRKKLLTDLGGTWEQLEEEIVDATEYQQDKTLYVQVFIAGKSSDYEPVVYSTQNAALSGYQWSTNLVYNDETATWMEYTQKHEYNDSRVGYTINGLYNSEGGWDALKETMDESDVWQPVEVPADAADLTTETPAADTEG